MPGDGTVSQVSCPSPVLHTQYRTVLTFQQALALVLLQASDLTAPRLSAAVLWAQLGEVLQHLCQAACEAEYQHVFLNVHRKLHELDELSMREQMEQQLQPWFPECWLVAEWEGGFAAIPYPHSSPTAVWAPSTILPTCAK